MSANHPSFPNIDFHLQLTTRTTFYLRIFIRYINLFQFSTLHKHGTLLLKYENIQSIMLILQYLLRIIPN